MKIIDLTHTIDSKIPYYPGDTKPTIVQSKFIDKDGYNDSTIHTSMHIGTHLDAPSHMSNINLNIKDIPLSRLIGHAILLDVRGETIIDYKDNYDHLINENDMILFLTGHDQLFYADTHYKIYPSLSKEMVDFLIFKKVKLIGLDTPSPDLYPFPHHERLLTNNILITENLTNLNKLVGLNNIELHVIPLKIDASGSPARVYVLLK